jgi:hypothetical protein
LLCGWSIWLTLCISRICPAMKAWACWAQHN